jgi:hypothetical protein
MDSLDAGINWMPANPGSFTDTGVLSLATRGLSQGSTGGVAHTSPNGRSVRMRLAASKVGLFTLGPLSRLCATKLNAPNDLNARFAPWPAPYVSGWPES